MKATIQILGTDLLCHSQGTTVPEHRLEGVETLALLRDWAVRYESVTHRGDDSALLDIGRELFGWLNPSGWAEAWVKASGPRQLDIIVDDPTTPLARALLDAPWELLANPQGHLADDSVQLFELVRRIGREAAPLEPRHSDVQLLFMAAAPISETPLDFEAEETAILDATQRLPLHLVVEESGAASFLGERLDLDGPFEALHLSCHGDIHPTLGPVLALEDETGARALTDAGQFIRALGDPNALPLVFLSACRTAEQLESGTRTTEPFVRELVRAGIANVLGWDGSVYDADALAYARSFYGELASLQTVPRAAAVARQALRQHQMNNLQTGRHWHLARLYLGPIGGGKLAVRGKPKRKPAGGEEQFLDPTHQQVPVAGRGEFVGRRRATQDVIRSFRDSSNGVLVHGMGNLGKSSLAYRIAIRHPHHEKVVIFGRYDALAIFDRITEALPATSRKAVIDTWRNAILADTTSLADAIETLLEGPFDTTPILLIIDDLERILEVPSQSTTATTPVLSGFRKSLAAVISAFQRARTDSRLLLTSRYCFSLNTAQGGDLAKGLVHVPLQPMDETDRRKQLRAAARLAQKERFEGVDTDLLLQVLQMAEGNPGLQAILTRPILAGENGVAEKALADIAHFQRFGVPPEDIQTLIEQGVAADPDNAAVVFFERMAFDAYRNALTPDQAETLRAACLFSPGLPIPRSAVEAAGLAAGVPVPAAALDRLIGLGLVDDWGQSTQTALVAANPLARPLSGNLDAVLGAKLSDAALPELDRHWRKPDGTFPLNARSLETARLALTARAPSASTLDGASAAAARFLFNQNEARRALNALLRPALARLKTLATPVSTDLLLITVDCAERLAEADLLEQALDQCEHVEGDPFTKGSVLLRIGRRHQTRGNLDAAQKAVTQAAEYFGGIGAIRDRTIALGQIADIHYARGELDEALRIRIEEQLPVFEKLGDVRSRAVTLGKIAQIHQARGELDQALELNEQRRPIAEMLRDINGLAHIHFLNAQIRLERGDHERGALQAIYEDLAAAYELNIKLGRPDGIGGVGSILAQVMAMGGLKDEVPVVLNTAEAAFRKLGNPEGIAHIAKLRQMILDRG